MGASAQCSSSEWVSRSACCSETSTTEHSGQTKLNCPLQVTCSSSAIDRGAWQCGHTILIILLSLVTVILYSCLWSAILYANDNKSVTNTRLLVVARAALLACLFDNLRACAPTMTLKRTRHGSMPTLALLTCLWVSNPASGLDITDPLSGSTNSLMSAMTPFRSGNCSLGHSA